MLTVLVITHAQPHAMLPLLDPLEPLEIPLTRPVPLTLDPKLLLVSSFWLSLPFLGT